MMWRRLKTLWRRLTNRCPICGTKRPKRAAMDVYTWGPWCRGCNKRVMFGSFYGMGEKKARGG